jgi:hypothetical protein
MAIFLGMAFPSPVLVALHFHTCKCTFAAGDGRVMEANGGRLPLLTNERGAPLWGKPTTIEHFSALYLFAADKHSGLRAAHYRMEELWQTGSLTWTFATSSHHSFRKAPR